MVETAQPSYRGQARDDLVEVILSAVVSRGRALDIGCGEGGLGARLLREGFGEVWGVEPHEAAAEIASRRLTRVVRGSFPECADKLSGPFDLMVMGDSLEHMVDSEAALRAARGLLSIGGSLVLSVPNVSNYSVIRGLIRGRWTYRDGGLLDRTHVRFFTPASLEDLLLATAWEPVARHDNLSSPRRILAPLTWALSVLAPHTLVYQMVVVARPSDAG